MVLFLFLQLFLWLFVGRKSLIQLAPDMIVDDVHSVALLGSERRNAPIYPERLYVIGEGLAQAIGGDRLDALSASLGRFNGTVMAEDDGTYIERASQDGCDDCFFVGIRQVVNCAPRGSRADLRRAASEARPPDARTSGPRAIWHEDAPAVLPEAAPQIDPPFWGQTPGNTGNQRLTLPRFGVVCPT